jgi:hypothetical protein
MTLISVDLKEYLEQEALKILAIVKEEINSEAFLREYRELYTQALAGLVNDIEQANRLVNESHFCIYAFTKCYVIFHMAKILEKNYGFSELEASRFVQVLELASLGVIEELKEQDALEY